MQSRPLYTILSVVVVLAACRSRGEQAKPTDKRSQPSGARVGAAVSTARDIAARANRRGDEQSSEKARRRTEFGFEWKSFRPPSAAAGRGTLEVDDRELRVGIGETTFRIPRPLSFDECSRESEEPENDGEESKHERRTAWWLLSAGERRVGLGFGVDGVVLAARERDTGCVRTTELADKLLGTDSEDPVFDPAPYDDNEDVLRAEVGGGSSGATSDTPEVIGDLLPGVSGEERLVMGSTGGALRAGDRVVLGLSVKPGGLKDWSATLAGREGRFVRFVIEGDGADGDVSHRHLVAWDVPIPESGRPLLEQRQTWGGDGEGHQDERVVVTRRWDLSGARLIANGTHEEVDAAMMLGVGRCPQMEGMTDIFSGRTTVKWSLEHADGSTTRIGTARETKTRVAGCEKEARLELDSRGMYYERLEPPTVEWQYGKSAPE
jgi:hypothetical protein